MGVIASQITSLRIVYSTVYSDADQRKHQSSASLAFVRGIHRGPVISPHEWPVTRKMFPFDDVSCYWPFVRETTGGFPSRKTSNVEHWCYLWCQSKRTFEQTVHEQVIWYVLKLFDVSVMIYNKIWMNTSHEINMNPWLAINFARLYQKRNKCLK